MLGFGAGPLIAGISFQLARGGYQAGGPWPLAISLAAGALVFFFFADLAVEKWAIRTGGVAGLSLALGGLLEASVTRGPFEGLVRRVRGRRCWSCSSGR